MNLVAYVWTLHNAPSSQPAVFHLDKPYTIHFLHAPSSSQSHPQHRTLTLQQIGALLHVIRYSALLQFQRGVYQQTQGIPMGIPSGVFLANMFLAAQELKWLRTLCAIINQGPRADVQRVLLHTHSNTLHTLHHTELTGAALATYVLLCFRFIARFVDDLLIILNKVISALLYQHQQLQNIPGIYPSCLNVALTPSAPTCHFLDITITASDHDPLFLNSSLYSKFQEPQFQHLHHSSIPPAITCLSRQCKANIIHTQVQRYTIRCTTPQAFLVAAHTFKHMCIEAQ